MESRNYACDYNFDWVEKMQPYANKVFGYVYFIEGKTTDFYLCRIPRVNLSINQQINMIFHRVHYLEQRIK
jgi:hypothetical protein